MTDAEALLTKVYAAYNRRDYEALATMTTPDVVWPDQIQGGWLSGRPALLAYWRENATRIIADVAPVRFAALPDGRTAVDVNQVVRSVTGPVWSDTCVRHIYTLRDGLIARLDLAAVPDDASGDIGP